MSNHADETSPVVYLAGKIGKNDWRHELVEELRSYGSNELYEDPTKEWPILPNAIEGGFSYSGPFFIACDHGCSHGENTHGYDEGCLGPAFYDEIKRRDNTQRKVHIAEQCRKALERSDYVFAWIDDLTAYGTLFELGYAKALGKKIFLAIPEHFHDERELWFSFISIESSSNNRVLRTDRTPVQTFIEIFVPYVEHLRDLDRKRNLLESPIEKMFFDECQHWGSLADIEPQWEITINEKKYRADFAFPESKTTIELDGHEYHKTKEQRTSDAQRERAFKSAGWNVIRFTGSEIYKDTKKCVGEAYRLILGEA
jgi:hypothetical protein